MVTTSYLNVLTKDTTRFVLYSSSSCEIWNELYDLFGQLKRAELYQHHKEILNLSQGTNDHSTYFMKLHKS